MSSIIQFVYFSIYYHSAIWTLLTQHIKLALAPSPLSPLWPGQWWFVFWESHTILSNFPHLEQGERKRIVENYVLLKSFSWIRKGRMAISMLEESPLLLSAPSSYPTLKPLTCRPGCQLGWFCLLGENAWSHSGLSQLMFEGAQACIANRDQGCCWTSCNAQDRTTPMPSTKIIQPKLLIVPS